jgi:hypothetical protein
LICFCLILSSLFECHRHALVLIARPPVFKKRIKLQKKKELLFDGRAKQAFRGLFTFHYVKTKKMQHN